MLGVIKKKQNNSLYVVTSRCAAALHTTGFSVHSQLCPSHDKIKHHLNWSQYPQAPVVLQEMTENILSLAPEFLIFQANAPFYNLTALPALLQKTKMTKAG